MSSAITALQQLPADIRLHRLEALVIASESLNRATGLNDILHTILDLIPTQLNCERATVFLHDRRTGKLHARQMSGTEHIEIVLEPGIGIAGHVAECGESVLLNDVQSDPRFDRATDLRTGFVTKTMLCVSLRKPAGALLGSLQAINSGAGAFSPADLAYLESFAALAAVAVEREQLAQEAMRSQLLSTELELARKIQQRLLPSPGEINLPAPFSAWGLSQACYDVGGDAYDAMMLPSGECAFWVADVSGKGIGAALLMTTLQTELRGLVLSENNLAQLATELNTRVTAVAPLGTYATLFLGVLNASARRLRYVNGGHMSPLWINSQSTEARDCAATGMPVGLLPGTIYETGECGFARGERLALFSDGITDSEDVSGETYETENLVSSLNSLASERVADIGVHVFADLDRFRIGAPAKDDTTFLAIGLA
jgi:serine phosphatase RsbU (regulator of sigma subunit)